MKILTFLMLMGISSVCSVATDVDESFVLPDKILNIWKDAKRLRFGDEVSNTSFGLEGHTYAKTENISTLVRSDLGVAWEVVFEVTQKWFLEAKEKGDLTFSKGNRIGGAKTGGFDFTSQTWSYQIKGTGLGGRLTIWFPDTKKESMRMIVLIDERIPDNHRIE